MQEIEILRNSDVYKFTCVSYIKNVIYSNIFAKVLQIVVITGDLGASHSLLCRGGSFRGFPGFYGCYCTFILFRMLCKASTSIAVPEAPCSFNTSSALLLMKLFFCTERTVVFICVSRCCMISWWETFREWKLPFEGAVDRLFVLRYGCSCFRRTRANATLSSFCSSSNGTFLL